MSILVTGSSGHLGEALLRTLRAEGRAAVGLDIAPGLFTDVVGSVADRDCVVRAVRGARAVLHAATLHKPHVATHGREAFVETNVRGTLVLLEEAARAGVESFVLTSTTSAFGDALKAPPGEPAAWIDETVASVPKNIYGVTKTAAEDLCRLFWRNERLPCVVLRTSRFFPEADDDQDARAAFAPDNLKTNEFLHRRVAIEDVVDAHLMAAERAPAIGFGLYVISATTPFRRGDAARLRSDAIAVARRAGRGVGGRIRPPRLAHGVLDRSRLRQRAGSARARLAAELGFRGGCLAAEGDRRPARTAGEADRREGLPRRGLRWAARSRRPRSALNERSRRRRRDLIDGRFFCRRLSPALDNH